MTDDKPWQDRETLRKLYVDDELSAARIAEKFDGITRNGIYYWLDKHDIEKRSKSDAATIRHSTNLPSLYTDARYGYERIVTAFDGDRHTVLIHRLVAVAEYGVDEVKDMAVHHKNGIQWDNRPSNLEVMTLSEHSQYHSSNLARGSHE